jgi:hypothetical protein
MPRRCGERQPEVHLPGGTFRVRALGTKKPSPISHGCRASRSGPAVRPWRARSRRRSATPARAQNWKIWRDLDSVLADPARRSETAQAKAARQHDENGRPYRSFRGLLAHLATLTRNQVRFPATGTDIPVLAQPTSQQRQAFDLIGTPIPLALK